MKRFILAFVGMAFLQLLLGLFLPFAFLAILIGTLRDAVTGRFVGNEDGMDARSIMTGIVGLTGVVLAEMAPLKAVARGVLGLVEGQGETVVAPLRFVLATPWLDPLIGAAAIVLGVVTLLRLGTTWTKARHIENLPTSRARSAAAGLVELRGTARAAPPQVGIPDVTMRGPRLPWRSLVPADALVYKGSNQTGDPTMKATRCTFMRPFYLEDATGRILVDPRGAQVGSAKTIHIAGEPPARLALDKDQLREGDPVYVLGTVDVRADAPALAADADRVVVSALPPGAWSPQAARARGGWLAGHLLKRRVFLVSDSPEFVLRDALGKALVEAFACGVIVLVGGVWLLLTIASSR